MSEGSIGNNSTLEGAKIQPLASPVKEGVPVDTSHRGGAGSDEVINRARVQPLGGHGQYQHPAPHADSGGCVGRDYIIQGARIEPLSPEENFKKGGVGLDGLDDEEIDAARIEPMGAVRE